MAKSTSTPATKSSKSVTKSLATKNALSKKSEIKTGAKTSAGGGTASKAKLTTKAASKTAGGTTSKQTSPAKKAGEKSVTKSKSSTQKSVQQSVKSQDHQLLLASASSDQASPSTEERQAMIQEAAYHIAEKDGFQPGLEETYWHRAEEQIRQLLNEQDQGSGIL